MDEQWLRVEVEGQEGTHAALRASRETLCGQVGSFPAGKGEPSCLPCRQALGLPVEAP
jgi:hypothetical protein